MEDPQPSRPTMRSMDEEEIATFVSSAGFGILALADAGRAFGVPLFYGVRDGAVFFQTRAGEKTHYLYATMEACLTIARPQGAAEWGCVQLFGRLERVDAQAPAARAAMADVPPPLLWSSDDERENDAQAPGLTTFRLVPTRRMGRYSQPARLEGEARFAGL